MYALIWGCIPMWLYADPIGTERARQIASAFMKERGREPRLVKRSRAIKSESEEKQSVAPLYIYSRGENQGFVIVSGDDCLPEVLGYTESGDFVENRMPPALLEMIDGYSQLIEAAQACKAPARVQHRAGGGKNDIAPLLQTHWHQSAPYNDLAPLRADGGGRSATGCVATAAAQVAYYWWKDLPKKTGYDTPTYGYGEPVTESVAKGTPYQWELMQPSYGGSYPAEMGNAVARLMYVVGTSTWLTYGSSTSGQISNLVNTFSGQFDMNSTCWYKAGNSEAYWENIIYEDLSLGRPIVYSGVHATNGGHAIVLDGYRASDNKFHFNFGWGGQGDGYYTLDDETGVNGFASQQGMTFRIAPRKLNLSAVIEADEFLQRTNNTIRVTFTNESSLDNYKGVYLFCLTGSSTPSDITKATRSDVNTVIPSGESRSFDFSFQASASGTYNLFVTDRDLHILHKLAVQSVPSLADLTLKKMEVDAAGTETESIELEGNRQDISVRKVYNNKADVRALLYNGDGGTYCEPSVKCELFSYDEVKKTFVQQTVRTVSNVGFPKGETGTAAYTFTSLKPNLLYKARLNPQVTTGKFSTIEIDTPDSVVYFRALGADLKITDQTEREIRLTGHWDKSVFASLAKDSLIACYDLTQVEGVASGPVAANKNALFYVKADADVEGVNIVQDGVCAQLELTTGYDFQPKEDFRALQATLFHRQTPARWNVLMLPFDCEVPQGIMARKINKLRLLSISDCDSVNTIMKSGTPYQCIVGNASVDRFAARNVQVSVNVPSEGTDSVRGTFVNKIATNKEFLLDDGEVQYFVESTGTLIPAFTGYLPYAKKVSSLSAAYRDKDRTTKNLAVALNEACAVFDAFKDKVDDEAYIALSVVIERAKEALTMQPQHTVLQSMVNELNAAVENYKNALPPVRVDGMEDKTGFIVNPSFEQGNTRGWVIENADAGVFANVNRPASSLANTMVGTDGNYIFHTYSSGDKAADLVQTITGLPKGNYQIRVLFGGAAGGKALLIANEISQEISSSDFGPMYFEERVLDDVYVSDGTLTLGIRNPGSWYKVDNFRLYYKGDITPVEEAIVKTELPVVSGGDGYITVITSKPTPITVYSVDGMFTVQRVVNGTETIRGLKRGLYIVNGQKVLVY